MQELKGEQERSSAAVGVWYELARSYGSLGPGRKTIHKPLLLPSLCTSERVSGEANFEKRRKTRHKPLLLPSLCTSERVSGEANFEKIRKTTHKRREAIWEAIWGSKWSTTF